MRKWLIWGLAMVATTGWQLRAGFERCGAIDGGILLGPVVLLVVALVKGVTRDLREVFGETSSQRRMTDA